ncbi:MAG TPA: CUAEP/CCAEP-tail radical SAM protein, partial [Acidimicrobiia bacterium]|nr:CUAEP/CCAEP-tail radical SAM protein [Acidimicrobiia bacterium]
MSLLLVSTYELGRQPVHLASPTAALVAGGVDVIPLDLAVADWDTEFVDRVDGVAFSVPMHTAMRLAVSLAGMVREQRPELPIAFFGLYAGVGSERTLGGLADAVFVGEYEPDLVAWAQELGEPRTGRPEINSHLGPSRFRTPDRSMLPGHENYARLDWEGEARVAGAVEASHGCRHRCRHCPIPVVYDGRMRVVGSDVVLSDIDQLVGQGVEHVTFGDPDFLNAPRYSLDV